MKYRIAISGSYGGMNLGDEAILEGILRELRASLDVDVVIFSFNPRDTERRHKVRAIPIREMNKDEIIDQLRRLDLFILGGGGILYDDSIEAYLRDVNWAKDLGIPVMIYAVSIGPLKAPESKQLITQVLNKIDKITVREREAKRLLNDLGVNQEIEVTADPGLLLKPQPFTKEMLKKEGINPDTPLVGFSVREPGPAAADLRGNSDRSVRAATLCVKGLRLLVGSGNADAADCGAQRRQAVRVSRSIVGFAKPHQKAARRESSAAAGTSQTDQSNSVRLVAIAKTGINQAVGSGTVYASPSPPRYPIFHQSAATHSATRRRNRRARRRRRPSRSRRGIGRRKRRRRCNFSGAIRIPRWQRDCGAGDADHVVSHPAAAP